jgi:hypothetical protein
MLAAMPGQPSFLLDLRFIDLTDWWLQLTCCDRVTCLPFRLLAMQKPAARFGDLLRALRCRDCGKRPRRVVLVDDPAVGAHGRTGGPAGWRIEILLPDRSQPAGQ